MLTYMLSKIGLSKKDLKPSRVIIRGMSGADLQNCVNLWKSVSLVMTSLPSQDFMSTNRNVLSFLVLDSAKNSNL